MEGVSCSACGSSNEPGRKFCGECGAPLARACSTCGMPNSASAKFCGECGNRLDEATSASTPAAPAAVAERKLVSVLFADLVGFTTASEGRDAEDTRELLSAYFDLARTIIERYGGTVEKFIGDAVMAVWGTPAANEDDPERAVRAGLELVSAVPTLDTALQARAGVLTGEAAVTLGAEGQGMVAGDLVNTASRIQSAADPGTVLVGEATKRATEAAVVYEDAGSHALKGRAEPVQLAQAVRIVAFRRGEGRSAGLEAPFVGRDRELKLVKDLFHATADEGKAHLLSVVGVGGIGKSRLAWEFEKYVDGLVGQAWWHRGRCLAYGDGVAYWALAEMVRMRARIAEDEPAEEARAKLAATVAQIVTDPEERVFVEPRLQHLLGLTERVAADREDVFSAWRLFIERMADQNPVIMVFEDVHWADTALLEFVAYLLEWSRSHPIFVIALARPEVAERHPAWNANLRNYTTLSLEPLPPDAIDALLVGLVPGLPEDAMRRIRERADGIPLYAVETVRMLLDRGLLEPEGTGFRVTGDLASLDVPETLQALIASRLDGLDGTERQLLQDAAVLGKTFSPRGLTALSGLADEDVRPVLASLVRKEVLFLDTDPRSPERGQYGFLQALVQRVAYDTLSRKHRKAKHLAAARYLSEDAGLDPDEIAEVVAAHVLDAYRAAPTDTDAEELKAEARSWLRRAGERAAALAAVDDAQRAFEAAVELADEPLDRARLLERAGDLAFIGNRLGEALAHLRAAHELCEEAGATHDAARITAALGVLLWQEGKIDEALRSMESAFAVLSQDEPDADVATLAAQLGRIHFFAGDRERASERLEFALDLAEALRLPAPLASALNTKSLVLIHRPHESRALLTEALRIALESDLVTEALRAYNNLGVLLDITDRPEETKPLLAEALELARRRGDRYAEVHITAALVGCLIDDGDWDEALALGETLPEGARGDATLNATWAAFAVAALDRGEADAARRWLARISDTDPGSDLLGRTIAVWKRELLADADGRIADALQIVASELVPLAIETSSAWGLAVSLSAAASLAARSGDAAAAAPAVAACEQLPNPTHTRAIDSQLHRVRAIVAAAAGDEESAADSFALALAAARNLNKPFWLAPVLFDYGRWLVETGRPEEAAPLLDEARALFEGMQARAWLERLDAVAPATATAAR